MKSTLFLLALLFTLSTFAEGRIAAYNIRNFDYDERARIPTNKGYLKTIISKLKADFIAVQEIREDQVFKGFIQKHFPKMETVLSTCGGAHGQKLGFVYNSDKYELLKFEEDLRVSNPFDLRRPTCHGGSRPLAIGTFLNKKTAEEFIAIAVHLKSGGSSSSIKKRFKQLAILKTVVKELNAKGSKKITILGDFNTTQYNNRGQEYKKFKSLVNEMGMHDASENIQCSSYWYGGRRDGKQYPSLLDHVLVSKSFSSKKPKNKLYGHCARLKCQITGDSNMGVSYDEVSDHCPQVTEL
jgi:endonuclease/exonuclease/phosphatase family metal-dependent hydrolase